MKKTSKLPEMSLYKQFTPGDRVRRFFKQKTSEHNVVEGIIMSMSHDQLDIYWDTIDGTYCPDLFKKEFSLCGFEDVMDGNKEYSPIKKKKRK